jgi:hypothetical protein
LNLRLNSFDAVNRIHNISHTILSEAYRFVSFDVTSLFTNIPLHEILKISWFAFTMTNYLNLILRREISRNCYSTLVLKLPFTSTFFFTNKLMVCQWKVHLDLL